MERGIVGSVMTNIMVDITVGVCVCVVLTDCSAAFMKQVLPRLCSPVAPRRSGAVSVSRRSVRPDPSVLGDIDIVKLTPSTSPYS